MKSPRYRGRTEILPEWRRRRIINPVDMTSTDLVTVDLEILGGTPVFRGTRVPVKTLFDYLENDYSLEEFLECFPSVSRDLARLVLERSEQALLTPTA